MQKWFKLLEKIKWQLEVLKVLLKIKFLNLYKINFKKKNKKKILENLIYK